MAAHGSVPGDDEQGDAEIECITQDWYENQLTQGVLTLVVTYLYPAANVQYLMEQDGRILYVNFHRIITLFTNFYLPGDLPEISGHEQPH